MSFDSLVNETRETLKQVLPDDIEVTDIELEGPHIVLYTKQLDAFLRSRSAFVAASWYGAIRRR
jgi:predicted metal-dependent RNase